MSKTPASPPAAKTATAPGKKAATKAATKVAIAPTAPTPAEDAPTDAPAAARPAPAAKPASKPVAKKAVASKPAEAADAPAAAAPTPEVGAGNRFTERFAPPKPPVRGHEPALPTAVKRAAPKPDPKLVNAWKTKTAAELSEAELLAMPEAEYMNEKQREFFRLRLKGLKDDLLSNAEETTENLREDTTIVPDPADRATIEEEHALELRTRDRERKLLKKISQSLARIDSGEYGYCDETGEAIGLGRLLARPTATLSLEAQQRREMKQKMFGD